MVKWYLATYQNGVFSNDLGIIESSGDYVYKLKNPIPIGKGPQESDWLRITIADNRVEEWVTENSSWTEDATLTGLEDDLVCWVYGYIVKYVIVAGDQKYTLEDLTTLNDIGKTNITSITITNSVTEIGENAFSDCSKLVSVTIPDSVTEIGKEAFSGCEKLTSVTIGEKVETIGADAFSGINNNVLFIIPEGVLTKLNEANPNPNLSYGIGKTFFGASNAILVKPYEYYTIVTNSKVYYLPSFSNNYDSYYNTNATITGNDIYNEEVSIDDVTTITAVTIGPSVTSIGDKAFGGCTNLASLNIPDSVKTIGYRAFYGCTSLASVTMGDSVTSIGDGAFQLCSKLKSVNIPKSVETIGVAAFVIGIDYDRNTAFFTSITIKTGTLLKNFTEINEFIRNEKLKYNTDDFPTRNDDLIINNNNNALIISTNPDRTSVTIPNTVTSIGDFAFHYSEKLTEVTIPDSVTSIGKHAFSVCRSLEEVNIPNLVETIGDSAFEDCSSLTEVTIGGSVKTIGTGAFIYCENLTEVNIPDSVKTIGDSAFYGCIRLESVTIGNSVTTIGNGVFSAIKTNATITISKTVLGNLNTKYNSTLAYGPNKSFFSGDTKVTLQPPA